jgi:hypothetical protein
MHLCNTESDGMNHFSHTEEEEKGVNTEAKTKELSAKES